MRSLAAAALGSLLLVAGCATGTWNQSPAFPDRQSSWTVPLLNPLTSDNPRVWVELRGPDGTLRALPLLVDSGAAFTTLPADVVDALGLARVERNSVRVIDAAGRGRGWRGAIVPEARIGSLVLREVPFFASEGAALLGADVLDQHPWSIERRRGVMTMGTAAWAGADVSNVDLRSRRWRRNHLELVLDGEPTLLYLDTGATHTAIDRTTGRQLRLAERELAHPRRYETAHGTMTVRKLFRADAARLGHEQLGPMHMLPLRGFRFGGALNDKVVGLLGMDVLSRYDFRVAWGERLQLRRSPDLLGSTEARLTRWPWLPTCQAGRRCVSASLEPVATDSARITIRARARYDRPTSFLFGCADPRGRIHPRMPWVEMVSPGLATGEVRRFRITQETHPSYGSVWARHAARECRSLPLLDVNPVEPSALGGDPTPLVRFHRRPLQAAASSR